MEEEEDLESPAWVLWKKNNIGANVHLNYFNNGNIMPKSGTKGLNSYDFASKSIDIKHFESFITNYSRDKITK